MTQVVSAAKPALSSRAIRALSNGSSGALEITNSMPTMAEHEVVVMRRESSPLLEERFDTQCSLCNRGEKEHQ
jgi:hypothetical protein